jgi:hypothetical protein
VLAAIAPPPGAPPSNLHHLRFELAHRKAAGTCGENVAVTETRIQTRISNLNSGDLFAGKWLRAPATTEVDSQRE